MFAIRVSRTGGPEVLEPVSVTEPAPSAGQLLVDVRGAGVNFLDIHFRRGTNPIAMPYIPGDEGVGVVRALGEGVTGFAIGDRVAWILGEGSYAEVAAVPTKSTVRIPDDMSDDAGFVLAQGLTAHYLAHDIVEPGPGLSVLVHAAAGGVGRLLTQILKIRGTRVIATVSDAAKEPAARAAGADDVIVYSDADFAGTVRELTGGKGVDAVYDGVGKDTFDRSLASLRRRGHFISFGAASGLVPPIDPRALLRAGSITFIRPGLRDFIETPEALRSRTADLFAWIKSGRLRVQIGGRFALKNAADAHRALESRRTVGKLILVTRAA